MNGEQIKQVEVTSKGYSSITINKNELVPGMYIYALIVDNKVIDTKKMILTE